MKIICFFLCYFSCLHVFTAERLYVIVDCCNNFPLHKYDDNGNPTGYNIGLIKEISGVINSDMEIKTERWSERLKDKKIYQDINNKWLGVLESGETFIKQNMRYFFIFLALMIFIIFFAILWLILLKRQVNVKTKELQKELFERKKIEEALCESESIFSTIFKKYPNPMSINTADGRYVDANEYFEEYTGFSKEEVIGKTTIELGIFDNAEARKKYLKKLLEKNEISNFELNLYTKDKRRVTGLTSSVIVKMKGENFIFTVLNDITERKNLEQALLENEEKFRMMFDDSPLGIFQTSMDERIIYVNNSFAQILGYDSVNETKRALNFNLSSIYVESGKRKLIIEEINNSNDGRHVEELQLYKKDKNVVIVLASFTKVYDEINNIYMLEGYIEDITERKTNEIKLKESLHEKEILLKEIHHRVKNNLQIISSLLNLQQNYLKNKEDVRIFQDSQNRVKSMAIIHEKLYESKDLSKVDLRDYINSLTHYLYLSYGVEYGRIKLVLDIDEIYFEIEKSISFGILINELISNCLKHAFPDGRKGTIMISLKKDGNKLEFIIKDDGKGLPGNFDISEINSLGLKLINNLTMQLNGFMEIDTVEGTAFKITFNE